MYHSPHEIAVAAWLLACGAIVAFAGAMLSQAGPFTLRAVMIAGIAVPVAARACLGADLPRVALGLTATQINLLAVLGPLHLLRVQIARGPVPGPAAKLSIADVFGWTIGLAVLLADLPTLIEASRPASGFSVLLLAGSILMGLVAVWVGVGTQWLWAKVLVLLFAASLLGVFIKSQNVPYLFIYLYMIEGAIAAILVMGVDRSRCLAAALTETPAVPTSRTDASKRVR